MTRPASQEPVNSSWPSVALRRASVSSTLVCYTGGSESRRSSLSPAIDIETMGCATQWRCLPGRGAEIAREVLQRALQHLQVERVVTRPIFTIGPWGRPATALHDFSYHKSGRGGNEARICRSNTPEHGTLSSQRRHPLI